MMTRRFIRLVTQAALRPGTAIVGLASDAAKAKIYTYSGGQEALLAAGSVTHYIAAQSCCISIDDPKAVGRMREGDMARPLIDESLIGKLKVW